MESLRSSLSPRSPWLSCPPPWPAHSSASPVSSAFSASFHECPCLPFALFYQVLCSVSLLILVGGTSLHNRLHTAPRANHYLFPKGDLFSSLTSPSSSFCNLLQCFSKSTPRPQAKILGLSQKFSGHRVSLLTSFLGGDFAA